MPENCFSLICNEQQCSGDTCIDAGTYCVTPSNLTDEQKQTIQSQLDSQVAYEAANAEFHANALTPPGSGSDTQSNNDGISIPSFGAATPYPSEITLADLPGVVTKVTVTLSGISHTFPSDINAMLVSPGGTSVGLMMGCSDGSSVSGVNITLDDDAGSAIPTGSPLTTGTYQPTNSCAPTCADFVPPAPSTQPSFDVLSAFNGEVANGTWQLYVLDGASGDSGSMTGWTLHVETGANPGVTEPVGGNFVIADTAEDSDTGGDWTELGPIFMKEGSVNDIATGTGVTLILTAPDGWQFRPGFGSVVHEAGRDITSSSVAVTGTTITLTLTIPTDTAIDEITISDVQIQPITGLAPPYYILNLSTNPGTASVAFVTQDVTTFGLLFTVAGRPRSLVFLQEPSTSGSVGFPPVPNAPFVNVTDQFGNVCSDDTWTSIHVDLFRGTGGLIGDTDLTCISGEADFYTLAYDTAGVKRIRFSVIGLLIHGVMSHVITIS